MVVKKKRKKRRKILGSSCFEIHGSTVMLTWTQNWDYLSVVSLGMPHMVLKLRKSKIKHFKRFVILSWNKGDMANRINAMQRTCYYGIIYESNSFRLFGLDFGLFLLALFCWQLSLLDFSIFTNPIFCYRTIFGNLDFIKILITKYATQSLKVMGKFYI